MRPVTTLPNTLELATHMKGVIKDTERAPLNYTSLFNSDLFKFDLSHIPAVLQLYKDLSLPHQPLSLVPPEFEVPLPPFELAVYPPQLKDLKKPDLELFDLEQEFASERESLAQITNKCLLSFFFFNLHFPLVDSTPLLLIILSLFFWCLP